MIKDIKTFCKLFYDSTLFPINYFDYQTDESLTFPENAGFHIITDDPSPEFLNFRKNPDYFLSDSFAYYGFIESKRHDFCLILGPLFSTPVSESMIHSFMKEWAINSDSRSMVVQFLQSTPLISFNQFINVLTYLHFSINDEIISVNEHFKLEDTSNMNQISGVHAENLVNSKENQRHHNTYYYEKKLMKYIQDGSVNKVKDLLSSSSALSEGIVADNTLRQEKNIFISIATLTTRNAILGGLNIEEAYQLSDIYIQECELSKDISHISNLSYTMLIDFTERVSRTKIPDGMSSEIFDCVQFITRHTNESVQVGDVAAHIRKSRSYLNKKFKQELGFDVSSFIMRCKLEEAKSLLTYTEKSLSEISSYLCFSSQAYFQNVFKKKYGMTPTKYRKNSRQINS